MRTLNKRFVKAINTLCTETGVTYEQLCMRKGKREYTTPAQLFITALYNKGYNLRESGEVFDKDHSTVYYSISTFNNLIESNKKYREKYGPVYEKVFKLIPEKGPICKERVYLCGRTTGIEFDEATENFMKATKRLRRSRYVNIYNPLFATEYLDNNFETNKKCFYRLLSCQIIYAMPDARQCPQAKLELQVAVNCGIKVINETDLI
ncbi:MAG: DUF4406 domain-containing protein [Bacteroidales bacterium]|nr:DUF4406 domain-containing protein [Bacteroidales bacterium]